MLVIKSLEDIYAGHFFERKTHSWLSFMAFAEVLYILRVGVIPMLFGLGTRLYVRMRAKLKNGVLRNGQQLQFAVNGTT